MKNKIDFVFWGTSDFSVNTLDELKKLGLVPKLIVCSPDKPVGRKQILTSPPAKVWAEENQIEYLQPRSLKKDSPELEQLKDKLKQIKLSLVASYGKIIPEQIIALSTLGMINVHPSLLPQLRGPSPLQTAILNDQRETGVTIIKIDAEMDHGPILAQEKVLVEPWPVTKDELGKILAPVGAKLVKEVFENLETHTLIETEQDHSKATFCKIIEKTDGELNLSQDAYKNFLRYKAFTTWPGTYFFAEKKDGSKIRVLIKNADFQDGKFIIKKILPEGRNEMSYEDFLRGLRK